MTARAHDAREARPLYGLYGATHRAELARELRRQLRAIDPALEPRRGKDEQLWAAHDDIHRVLVQLGARGLFDLADELLLVTYAMRCSLPPRHKCRGLPPLRRRRPRK